MIFHLFLVTGQGWSDALIDQLGSPQFSKRQEAIQHLVAASLKSRDEVINRLLEAEGSNDPEISHRAHSALHLVFLRLEKGRGAPDPGFVIKSKLINIDGKLATRPLVDDIREESQATKSGLQKGDLILAVEGQAFDGEDASSDLKAFLRQQTGGVRLKVEYSRKGEVGWANHETFLELGRDRTLSVMPGKNPEGFEAWKARELERRQ